MVSQNVMTTEDILELGLKIVEEAEKRGLKVRLVGAVAVCAHLKEYRDFWEKNLDRRLTDLDFAGYDKQRKDIEKMLEEVFGFGIMKAAVTPGLLLGRIIFWDKSPNPRIMPSGDKLHGDVFLDRLSMNHVIEWKGRLECDYPTIPLAELFLEKTQIVGGPKRLGLGEKDAKDVICMLLEHDVGTTDKETINVKVIAKTLAKDWGFYYTVTRNIGFIRDKWLKQLNIPEEYQKIVLEKLDKIQEAIEKEPKSLKWKLRARIGPSKKWYNEVEEVERAPWLEGLTKKS